MNISELLRSCPAGTKLWSDIHGECEYVGNSNSKHPLVINAHTKQGEVYEVSYTADGLWDIEYDGLCLLWPSKDHRTWDDWDEYKVNCLPQLERPKTYREACEILGIPHDENMCSWLKLRTLGEAWNRVDGIVEDLRKTTTYAPRVYDSKVGTVAILPHSSIGVPAMFLDEKTAVEFGKEFRDLYISLYYVVY